MAVVGTRARRRGGGVGRLGVFVWRAGGRDAALVGALCALQVAVIAAAYWCYKLNEGPDVFVGAIGGDEGLTLSLLKASVFRFENPWSLPSESDRAAFLVPGLGSVWLYAPIGYLGALVRIDPWVAHRLLIVAGIVASVVSAHCVLTRVLGPGRLVRIALVLFVCSSGAGGLVYLAAVLGRAAPFPPAPPFSGMVGVVTYEFFEGAALTPITQAFRSYYTIPMAMANVGLWSLHKTLTEASIRGSLITGASLALAVLWYPMIGLWYIAMAIVWIALEVARGLSGRRGLAPASAIRPCVAVLAGLAGLLPYLRSDIARSAMTAEYVGSRIAAVPQALFVGIALLLPFALVHVLRRTRDRMLTAALALWAFSYVLAPPGHGTGLLPRLLHIPVHAWLAGLRWAGWVLLGVACVRATRAWSLALGRQPRDAVLLIWLVLAMILAVQQPFRALPALFPARMMLVVWLPLTACAAMGMRSTAAWLRRRSSYRLHVGPRAICAVVVALGVPSWVGLFASLTARAWTIPPGSPARAPEFIGAGVHGAMRALGSEPPGVVLTSPAIGMYLPILTDDRSVLGRQIVVSGYDEKERLYRAFVSPSSPNSFRTASLQRLNVDYVLLTPEDRGIQDLLGRIPRLRELYRAPDGTSLYRVTPVEGPPGNR